MAIISEYEEWVFNDRMNDSRLDEIHLPLVSDFHSRFLLVKNNKLTSSTHYVLPKFKNAW